MTPEISRIPITKHCGQILDAAVDSFIIGDKKGKILSFNRAAEQMFGYEADEVVGEKITKLLPDPYAENYERYMRVYPDKKSPKTIAIGREVRGQRKDGSVFPMELSVSELYIEGELLFTGIARDISERRRLENEILQISEEERQNIGRELHDGLGQMLTGIGLITQNLARRLQEKGADEAQEVAEIAEMLQEADQHARALSHGLVISDLKGQHIETVLRQLCEQSGRLFEISCPCEVHPTIEIDDQLMIFHLYRIVQEAIRNAYQHGRATFVEVSLQHHHDFLQLVIKDNGSGFSDSIDCEKQKGIGLHTMSYRTGLLGGYISFETTEEGSVLVDCRIPVHTSITTNKRVKSYEQ